MVVMGKEAVGLRKYVYYYLDMRLISFIAIGVGLFVFLISLLMGARFFVAITRGVVASFFIGIELYLVYRLIVLRDPELVWYIKTVFGMEGSRGGTSTPKQKEQKGKNVDFVVGSEELPEILSGKLGGKDAEEAFKKLIEEKGVEEVAKLVKLYLEEDTKE